MTTLDDLLALLPDNTTGQISAADMRTVVTGLWNSGADLEARVADLEVAGGGAPTVTGRWQINPQAGAIPGGQQVTCDTGIFSTATWLRFAPVDQDGVDLTQALVAAQRIYAQQASSSANWCRFTVTDAADVGQYVELTVTVEDFAGSVSSAGWQSAIAALSGASP